MINYGMNSIKIKKLIGNKKIILIGSNGKWKLKIVKLTIYKNKKEDNNTNYKINKEKNKKNFKNTSVKFNYATI